MKLELLKNKETFELEIPADENNLSEVRDFVADICTRAGFSKRETNNTKLAMDEACTNIIKHAYRDTAGNIRIKVEASPGRIDINVFDKGKTFEWSNVKDPDLQRYVEIGKKGGLGIFLMNRLMDALDYQSTGEGNRLTMSKTSESATGRSSTPIFSGIKQKWSSTLRFKFALRAGIGLFSLVFFLWIVQFMNQSREIESQESQKWLSMSNLARSLEAKSENAIVIDDIYDPEYREINDYIQDRLAKLPEIEYVRVINGDGIIVSSSDVDEFLESFEIDREKISISKDGQWFSVLEDDGGIINEFHYPIRLSIEATETELSLGRVILGISVSAIKGGIYDPRPRTGLILGGILLVGMALIYLLISVFVKPIQDLTDGVRAMGEGALENGIHIEGPEEIGAIASAFNDITMKFREAQQNVVEQERLQKEMQVAQEIQHSLLPSKVPAISGYDIASLYRAAKEVGGDYYDFVNVGEDSLGVVVADVSGKGVPGSLVMTMIRTALRMEARGSHSAAEVMARMNDFVTEDMKKGMFVTIFYVILDSKNRIISYASAGHNPMILFRAETDETFFLNPRGFPVGISLPDDTLFRRSIDVEKIKLKKDDMLIIYTDGVTEAMNEERDQYGEDRLIELIKKNGRKTPDEFIDSLNEDIRAFTGDYPQNDDITVVAVKEKLMADDVLYGIRKKLMDLVDVDGLTVAEACTRMRVSPSTYYRYRKRLTEMGERGLKNKTLREEEEIRRVSTEQRKGLLRIIRGNPSFGAKRIATLFNEDKNEKDELKPSLIYDELKRMRLNTYEKRLEYLRRNRLISEEEYQSLLSGKSAGKPAAAALEVKVPEEVPDTQVASEDEEIEEVGSSVEEVISELEAVVVDEPAGEERVEESIPSMDEEKEDPPLRISRYRDEGPQEVDSIEKVLSDVMADVDSEGKVLSIVPEELDEGVILLRVKGHLDSSSTADLESILENVYSFGFRKIIVDLAEVSYISSGGWGIFTGRVKELRDGAGDVVLAGMSPEVFDIYELLGFQDIIMHCQTIEEAVEFIMLPFEERQGRLLSTGSGSERENVFEHRISASDLDLGDQEETTPWTPLTVEAGTVGQEGEITVLNLNGVIDTVSCLKLKGIMNELVTKGASKLLIDMSRVEYVSSAGWGVFASKIDQLRGRGGDIKVFGMDPEVDSIFHLLGFDVIMRSFSIMAEAIEDFSIPVGQEMFSNLDIAGDPDSGTSAPVPLSTSERKELEESLNLEVSRKSTRGGESMVLQLEGAIDAATTTRFEDYLERCISEGPKYFIIDLSNVIYISSSGWGVIIKYMQKMTGMKGKVALSGMTPPIFKIFRDLGFEPLVPNYLTADAALKELSAPGMDDHEGDGREGIGDRKSSVAGDPGSEEMTRDPVVETTEAETDAGVVADDSKDVPAVEVTDKEYKKKSGPKVEAAGIAPMSTGPREKADGLDVEFDLKSREDDSSQKDSKLRDIGWKEYGKRLADRNRNKKKE